jgi:transporter family protein
MEALSIFLALVAILLWGIWGVAAKFGVESLGQYQYVLVLNLIMVTVIIITLFVTNKIQMSLSQNYIYPLIGGFCAGIGSILIYELIARNPTSIVIPFSALYPALTVFILVFLLKVEELTLVKFVGIGLAMIAAFLLAF